MVEKITVNPESIRAYGNIMSPHSSSDYELEDCTIATGTDTVNGATETVYTLTSTATHSYSLSFGSASYTATGGSCTVSVTLTDNSTPVENATISVTGGTGGSGSGTTNSSGVASINVTGVTASGTLTASFQSATATASVTYASYLFYDACNSASGLSNYGSSVVLRGTNASATISYNSSENAYEISGTGNYFAGIPITPLNGEDNFKITAEMKCVSNSGDCQIGFYTRDSSDTSKQAYSTHLLGDARYRWFYVTPSANGSFQAINTSSAHYSSYTKMEWIVEDTSIEMNIYDSNDDVAYTITKDRADYTNKEYGLWVDTEKGTSYACYVKNIKATPYTAPVSSYNLEFSQDTYTPDMFGEVSVSCTLKQSNTPMSGETITFSYQGIVVTESVTATTNSSGVATHTFDQFDFPSLPATLTASYQGVTATCTIVEG